MKKKPQTTIVVADDHRLFRESLRRLLESDEEFRVVGEASDGREAIELVVERQPDILLLDLAMPRLPGLGTLRELSLLRTDVRTLVLTASLGDSDTLDALRLGARGVVLKDTATDLVFKSIRAVMAGEYWIGRERVGDLIEQMRERALSPGEGPRQATCGFTSRQLDIISAILAGATNRDIAKQFSISPRTVKYHLQHMFDRAGVSNRVELALFAVEHHLDRTLYGR